MHAEPLLALALCTAAGAAELQLIGWGGGLSYAGETSRSDGGFAGMYGKAGDDHLCIEAGWEGTRIGFADGSRINQQDATLLLGLHPYPDATARMGVHLTWDAAGDLIGSTVIADAAEGYAGGWWSGLTVAVSHLTVAVPSIYAVQASPRGGWSWQLADGLAIEPSAGATASCLDRDPGFDRQSFFSLEGALAICFAPVRLEAAGWTGTRCYHVAQQGFVVYDLPALYRHGWSFALTTDLPRGAWCGLLVGRDNFRHIDAHADATADRLIAMFGLTF